MFIIGQKKAFELLLASNSMQERSKMIHGEREDPALAYEPIEDKIYVIGGGS